MSYTLNTYKCKCYILTIGQTNQIYLALERVYGIKNIYPWLEKVEGMTNIYPWLERVEEMEEA